MEGETVTVTVSVTTSTEQSFALTIAADTVFLKFRVRVKKFSSIQTTL